MKIFGNKDLFAFSLRPLAGAPAETDPSAAATWAALQIWVRGRNLAAHVHPLREEYEDSLNWPIAYIARWVVGNWSALFEEQRPPLPGPWRNARDLCEELDRQLAEDEELTEEEADDLADTRDRYVLAHSASAGSAGGLVPDFYIARDGDRVSIAWESIERRDVRFLETHGEFDIPVEVFIDAARGIVDWTAETLRPIEHSVCGEDVRSFDRWLEKLAAPESALRVLEGYIGRSWRQVASVVKGSSVRELLGMPEDWKEAGASFDPTRFPAVLAFRSATTPVMSLHEAAALLTELRALPSGTLNERLNQLVDLVSGYPAMPMRDFECGYRIAQVLRRALGNEDELLDIEALLEELGISLQDIALTDPEIDGGATWEAAHGPLIFINPNSVRAKVEWGRRMILAHELCHILVDRRGTAGVIAVSSPWAPPVMERRANAFAAELLFPRRGIIRALGRIPRVMPSEQEMAILLDEFQIGRTTCERQLRNRFRLHSW